MISAAHIAVLRWEQRHSTQGYSFCSASYWAALLLGKSVFEAHDQVALEFLSDFGCFGYRSDF
jgi:hypothetical protein